MAVTLEELKQKIERLQKDLAEVNRAVDELIRSTPANGATPVRRDPLAGLRFSDPKELLPVIDRAFAEMGIDVSQPAMHPREVQELMLREGVRPEDNLGSRGIIAAREE